MESWEDFRKFREIWLSRETPIAGVITSITFVLAKAESEKKLKKIREMLASLEYLLYFCRRESRNQCFEVRKLRGCRLD